MSYLMAVYADYFFILNDKLITLDLLFGFQLGFSHDIITCSYWHGWY